MNGGAFRSLSLAMFRGFVRDRVAMVFSILIPVLFLLLFGSIYKDSATPRISVIEVGRVSLLDQASAASHSQLGNVMSITRSGSLTAALPAIGIMLGITAALTLVAVRVFRWDDI
jgi:ABC-2 type transport system permease protein